MKAIFITVRTGSKRFPKKCLKDVAGKMAIEHVIARAKRSMKAEIIVLCTTRLHEDCELCIIASGHRIEHYRGSAKDKLSRWRGAANTFDIDFFVTFDGDDLLCDPGLADLAILQHERTGADFIEAKNVPTGAFTYGISTKALKKVCSIKGTKDTEMMVPYFTKTGFFKVEKLRGVPQDWKRPDIRMTMDYPEDLEFFDNIYRHLGDNVTLWDIIKYLDINPHVIEINKHCQDKYLTNQKETTRMVLK